MRQSGAVGILVARTHFIQDVESDNWCRFVLMHNYLQTIIEFELIKVYHTYMFVCKIIKLTHTLFGIECLSYIYYIDFSHKTEADDFAVAVIFAE